MRESECAHFHGTDVAKPIPSYQVYKGTVFQLVDQAVDFVVSKINLAVGTRAHFRPRSRSSNCASRTAPFLEVFFFDNGYHEQFALNLILQSSPTMRIYDNILLDAYGWDFIGNPLVPSPLNRSMSTGMEIGGGWWNALQLEDGTTLGLWSGTLNGGLQNGTPIPEPYPAILLIIGLVALFRHAGSSEKLWKRREP